MACMICPITFCSSCVTTSLDARRRARYDREPLYMSNNWRLMMALLVAGSIGVACYIYMSVKCTERHKLSSWSPNPLRYERGPCFSSADGYMAGTGLFSAILMGTCFGAIFVFAIEAVLRKGGRARNQSGLPDRTNGHIPSPYSSSTSTTTVYYPQPPMIPPMSSSPHVIANPLNDATNLSISPPPPSSSEGGLPLKS